jgi:general secretion pathway protein G
MKKGFSMIELLMVISIIGLLMTLFIPSLLGSQDKAREVGVKAVMHAFQTAVESYNVDYQAYPAGESISGAELFDLLNVGGYMISEPKNPFTGLSYTEDDAAGKITYVYNEKEGIYTLTGYKRDGETTILVLQNT